MDKLWKFASKADSFDFKDIEEALVEIKVVRSSFLGNCEFQYFI